MNLPGILLYPFTVLYDLVTRFRNHLYNIEYKRSFQFETNVIGVGNLTVGGTGKTPMVEYLIRLLSDKYHIATLSRGYGRKTRGFRIAGPQDSATTLGDEPMQFHLKFKNKVRVAVGEERADAIPNILFEFPDNQVIILDDAYQHRPVRPDLNILLTDYYRPFFRDYLLPSGRLREARKGAQRADIIVVTKCPASVDTRAWEENIRPYAFPEVLIAFSTIRYGEPVPVMHTQTLKNRVLLVTGIAHTEGLVAFIKEKYQLLDHLRHEDHHHYSKKDVEKIKARFAHHSGENLSVITTEKDMVKLRDPELMGYMSGLPLFYLPIETVFIKNGKAFEEKVLSSLKQY